MPSALYTRNFWTSDGFTTGVIAFNPPAGIRWVFTNIDLYVPGTITENTNGIADPAGGWIIGFPYDPTDGNQTYNWSGRLCVDHVADPPGPVPCALVLNIPASGHIDGWELDEP